MKKRITIISVLCIMLLVTACSSFSPMSKSYDGAMINSIQSDEGFYDEGFSTGGDYSNTNITGEQADYSYSFTAAGRTQKSKADMLADYERIQEFVNSKDGYVTDVNNSYDFFDISESRYYDGDRIRYKAVGTIYFSAEIDNEYIPELVELLEEICKDNRFIVSDYTQRIKNYKPYELSQETDDGDRTITKQELERRLKYADIRVNIRYRIPRPFIEKTWLWIKGVFIGFWEIIGDMITGFLGIALGLYILHFPLILIYKDFRKMMYKHRLAHPEYYKGEKYVVISSGASEENPGKTSSRNKNSC